MARPKQTREDEDARNRADLCCTTSRIAFLAGVSHPTVSNARAEDGLPVNADGTMSWPDVRAWAKQRGKLGYNLPRGASASTVPVGSAEDYDTTIKRLKAAAAQRDHDIAMGLLIPKADAVAAQMRLAFEFKAALLQLPDQMSTALANLSSRDVEAALRERVLWILSQAQDGDLPIDAAMLDAIAKLVAERMATAT